MRVCGELIGISSTPLNIIVIKGPSYTQILTHSHFVDFGKPGHHVERLCHNRNHSGSPNAQVVLGRAM